MILRSTSGDQTASIPNRWVDSDGNVHEYPADLKELRIEFIDSRDTISTPTLFVKVSN